MSTRKFDPQLIRALWEDLKVGSTLPVKTSPFRIAFHLGARGEMTIIFTFQGIFDFNVSSSAGFELQVEHEEGCTELRVINQGDDPSLFELLSMDLVALTGDCSGFEQEDCAMVVKERIGAWQKFMKASAQPFSERREKGLFGELWVLKQWLEMGGSEQDLYRVWTGPTPQSHDFEFPRGYGIEVKTSTRAAPFRVHVESLEQLDTLECPKLSLVAVCLSEVNEEEKGDSVLTLVKKIEELLKQKASKMVLMSKLIAYGFNTENLPRSLKFFEVEFVRAFDTESLPRLTPAMCPHLIAAHYDFLLLDEEGEAFETMKEQDFESLIREVIEEG